MRDSWFALPGDKNVQRLEFHLVTRCSCHCAFCSEAHRMQAFHDEGFDWDEALQVLRKYAGEGFNHLNVTGGEPTLFPKLPELLTEAQSLGYTTYMASNGTRTRKPEYFDRIAPVLNEICFSVHGIDAATHDGLTGLRGSHAGLMATLDFAAEAGLRMFFNIVAVRHNAHQIPAIVALAAAKGVDGILVSNLAPEGMGLESYGDLSIRLGQWPAIAAEAKQAVAGTKSVLRFFGIPMCALGSARTMSNDLYFDPRLTVERIRIPGKGIGIVAVRSFNPHRERSYTPACASCGYRNMCGGVFAQYLETFHEDTGLIKAP